MSGAPPLTIVVFHKIIPHLAVAKQLRLCYNKHTNKTLVLTQEFGWRKGSMTEQVHKMQSNKRDSQNIRERLKKEVLNLSEDQIEYVLRRLRNEIL